MEPARCPDCGRLHDNPGTADGCAMDGAARALVVSFWILALHGLFVGCCSGGFLSLVLVAEPPPTWRLVAPFAWLALLAFGVLALEWIAACMVASGYRVLRTGGGGPPGWAWLAAATAAFAGVCSILIASLFLAVEMADRSWVEVLTALQGTPIMHFGLGFFLLLACLRTVRCLSRPGVRQFLLERERLRLTVSGRSPAARTSIDG